MLHRAYEAWPSVCFKMVTMLQRDRIFERLLGILIVGPPDSPDSGVPPAAARPSETVSRSKVVPKNRLFCASTMLLKNLKDSQTWLVVPTLESSC